MGRVNNIDQVEISSTRPQTSSLPLEERIKVIANLIVDEMIDSQSTDSKKQYE